MSTMHVELVAPERNVWSGEATAVSARTLSGEIGILPRHEPVLAALGAGTVRITTDEGVTVVAVDGGFLSVDASGVRVLAETAVLRDEIDVAQAREDLAAAERDSDEAGARRARALLAAADA
ncbi:MAG: synthase epsilon subunit [Mycobacterium sp.]|nr:synthase epsilon subunit [Mycobacterium sp.]MCW2746566.1 synthase epsilon subunit [Mycobacterium sp.]